MQMSKQQHFIKRLLKTNTKRIYYYYPLEYIFFNYKDL